jgi:GNAT superfamily N-acetyltransferase
LKVGDEAAESRVTTVPLDPDEVGLVAPLHERLGLGGVDRLRSLLSNPQVRVRYIATSDRVIGYAIAMPWQDREDIMGIRLVLDPEMSPGAMPGLAAELAQGQGGVILYPVRPQLVAGLEEVGWTRLEELATYIREAGPLRPVPQACEVRPFMPSQLPGLMEVEHSAFPELWWTSSQIFLGLTDRPGCTFLVGERDGKVVGYCTTFRGSGRPSQVGRLGVHQAYQGQGIGSWLMYQGLAPLVADRVQLNTQVSNRASRRLYERFGFVVTDTTWLMERRPSGGAK